MYWDRRVFYLSSYHFWFQRYSVFSLLLLVTHRMWIVWNKFHLLPIKSWRLCRKTSLSNQMKCRNHRALLRIWLQVRSEINFQINSLKKLKLPELLHYNKYKISNLQIYNGKWTDWNSCGNKLFILPRSISLTIISKGSVSLHKYMLKNVF